MSRQWARAASTSDGVDDSAPTPRSARSSLIRLRTCVSAALASGPLVTSAQPAVVAATVTSSVRRDTSGMVVGYVRGVRKQVGRRGPETPERRARQRPPPQRPRRRRGERDAEPDQPEPEWGLPYQLVTSAAGVARAELDDRPTRHAAAPGDAFERADDRGDDGVARLMDDRAAECAGHRGQ